MTAQVEASSDPADRQDPPGREPSRRGIGPVVSADDLPRSWRGALAALRLTGEDSDRNPGPRVLRFDDLGPLALLAETISAEHALVPDVHRLLGIGAHWPWGLRTLVSLSSSSSLRQAATQLNVHHSTLQERMAPLQAALGYDLGTADGRLRLHLSLHLHRLHLSGHLP